MPDDPQTCPECGARLAQGSTCQTLFEAFLVKDYTDPGYGQVHFLTVACFMIQHARYSDPALVWIHAQLRAFLEAGATDAEIRRIAAADADNARRTWMVARQPDAPPLPKIAWSLTIADVAAASPDAASYRKNVTRWARTTLAEMGPWIARL